MSGSDLGLATASSLTSIAGPPNIGEDITALGSKSADARRGGQAEKVLEVPPKVSPVSHHVLVEGAGSGPQSHAQLPVRSASSPLIMTNKSPSSTPFSHNPFAAGISASEISAPHPFAASPMHSMSKAGSVVAPPSSILSTSVTSTPATSHTIAASSSVGSAASSRAFHVSTKFPESDANEEDVEVPLSPPPPLQALRRSISHPASPVGPVFVVLDIGATQLRVGFAGEDVPRHIMRAVVGTLFRDLTVSVCGNDLLPLRDTPLLADIETLIFPASGDEVDYSALGALLRHSLLRVPAPSGRFVLGIDNVGSSAHARLSRRLRISQVCVAYLAYPRRSVCYRALSYN